MVSAAPPVDDALVQGPQLSDVEVQQLRVLFDRFKEENDTLKTELVVNIMRRLGFNPTPAEIEQVNNLVDAAHGGIVVFDDVIKAVVFLRSLPKRDQEHFNQCFRLFDEGGRGLLTRDEFIRVMTTYGVKMTPEEAEQFVALAPVDGEGNVLYADLIAKLVVTE
eukprot:EC725341.1.p1 GENE.EC725341.1~~EC725341.1.p1  ORF type:complete len:164 (+),score=36.15 EC725341.1:30-521(+)